jgi:hypothetical protein
LALVISAIERLTVQACPGELPFLIFFQLQHRDGANIFGEKECGVFAYVLGHMGFGESEMLALDEGWCWMVLEYVVLTLLPAELLEQPSLLL